jgi:hypothetical protein
MLAIENAIQALLCAAQFRNNMKDRETNLHMQAA